MKLAALGLLFALGCPKPYPPPEPPPVVDAGPPVATCEALCAHAAALGCPFSRPTPNGHTCQAVCLNVQGSGITSWNIECMVNAASCAAIDACEAP